MNKYLYDHNITLSNIFEWFWEVKFSNLNKDMIIIVARILNQMYMIKFILLWVFNKFTIFSYLK